MLVKTTLVRHAAIVRALNTTPGQSHRDRRHEPLAIRRSACISGERPAAALTARRQEDAALLRSFDQLLGQNSQRSGGPSPPPARARAAFASSGICSAMYCRRSMRNLIEMLTYCRARA